jgi:hypothetical protein
VKKPPQIYLGGFFVDQQKSDLSHFLVSKTVIFSSKKSDSFGKQEQKLKRELGLE